MEFGLLDVELKEIKGEEQVDPEVEMLQEVIDKDGQYGTGSSKS